MKKLLIIVAIILSAFLVIGYVIGKNYEQYSLSNDSYQYSMEYYKGANETTHPQNRKNVLESNDGRVVAIVHKAPQSSDCGSRRAKVAENVRVMENDFSMCYASGSSQESSLYTVDFEVNNLWHNFTIFTTDNSLINLNEAKLIAESINVNSN